MWGILGGMFVAAAWAIHAALAAAGVSFTAWHWAGLILWLLWVFFGAAVVWTLLAEREPRAAGVSAALFGSTALVIAGFLALIVRGF